MTNRGERGQVVVLVAVLLPVLLLLVGGVMDVGNWYLHKQRLQAAVDASVFSVGREFTGCFQDSNTRDTAIGSVALEYERMNLLPGNVSEALTANPCTSRDMLVEAADHEVGGLVGLLPQHPTIHARARSEIQTVSSVDAAMPLAIADPNPVSVGVLIQNEDSGEIVGRGELNRGNIVPPLPLNVFHAVLSGVGLSNGENFTVHVVTSLESDIDLGGALAEVCARPTYACYSNVSFVHVYTAQPAGTTAVPQVRSVELEGCGSPTAYFLVDACPLTVKATVDFGTGADNPSSYPVCASVAGMTWSGGVWQGSMSATTPGKNVLTLNWSSGHRTTGSCAQPTNGGPITRVARAYLADVGSGPIEYLKLSTNNTLKNVDANLEVTVGLVPLLVDHELGEDPVRLRFGPMAPNTTLASPGLAVGDTLVPNDAVLGDIVTSRIGTGCLERNHWGGPPWSIDLKDPRLIVMAVRSADDRVARFVGFYVTSAPGLSCPGDEPPTSGLRSIFGHFLTIAVSGGATGLACTGETADACTAVLVE